MRSSQGGHSTGGREELVARGLKHGIGNVTVLCNRELFLKEKPIRIVDGHQLTLPPKLLSSAGWRWCCRCYDTSYRPEGDLYPYSP